MPETDWRTRLSTLLPPLAPRVVQAFGHTGPLRFKAGREAVTHVDREVERHLASEILAAFPDHAVIGEEYGRQGAADAAVEWHVDPVDGTLNYALGIAFFSVSVAVVRQGTIEAGAVLDPLRGDLFVAVRGQGAWCGEHPLRVSERDTLRTSIGSFQSSRKGRFVQDAAILQGVHLSVSKLRRMGSVALELAHVARGNFDLLLTSKREPQNLYDVGAGVLLVEEAGGRVTDGRGRPFVVGSNELVATNGHVHDELLELVRPSEPSA